MCRLLQEEIGEENVLLGHAVTMISQVRVKLKTKYPYINV